MPENAHPTANGAGHARAGDPLRLPCGAELPNRIAKAAMTEGLADPLNRATQAHVNLYRRWGESGAGLLLTGNVQIDRKHLERPGNVAVAGPQSEEALRALKDYARAGTAGGAQLWMQISHAGRQTPAAVNPEPCAPSASKLTMPGAQFGQPRALSEGQIEEIIAGFGHAAKTARETGFTGVQLHAAHGYLLSEFLSPDVNRRTDRWGGSLENRARLLIEAVRVARKSTSSEFPIAVKLNSADFQRGGFSDGESQETARMLEREGIDLLEVSGGTYERPAMVGSTISSNPERLAQTRASTIAREAYFLDYAAAMRKTVALPLMVTGGFRTRAGITAALASGAVDVVGLARPFCTDPHAARRLLEGSADLDDYEARLRLGPGRLLGPASPLNLIRAINGWGAQGWFCLQLLEMGKGREPNLDMGVFAALRRYQANETAAARALKP